MYIIVKQTKNNKGLLTVEIWLENKDQQKRLGILDRDKETYTYEDMVENFRQFISAINMILPD